MKATIEFNLPEDAMEHSLAVNSKSWFFAMKAVRERVLDEGKSEVLISPLEVVVIIDDELRKRAIAFDVE